MVITRVFIFQQNVKEHATPLAGASVETGVDVHVAGDVADSAASGGCCVSTCSASSICVPDSELVTLEIEEIKGHVILPLLHVANRVFG